MMTTQQIAESIYKVLYAQVPRASLSSFNSDSRLREDLGLDAAAVQQLLVQIELEYGLSLPEEEATNAAFKTIRALSKGLCEAQRPFEFLEYDEDVKVHCVVSCLTEIIKRKNLDHRPLFFGVWDAEMLVDDQYTISYHSETVRHDDYLEWARRLYGIQVECWYDRGLDKEANIEKLVSLVEDRAEGEHIMVMLDMFQLPDRVNEYNRDPFPHYLMLATTPDPALWMVYDPDYRWEGVLPKKQILQAARHPIVSGGYLLFDGGIHRPRPADLKAYYDAGICLHHNPTTALVREVVSAHLEGRDKQGGPLPLSHLAEAVAELPLLAMRKFAYEHGLGFFYRALQLDEDEYDAWWELIEEMRKRYKLIQFQALKLAKSGDRQLAERIFSLLDLQDQREARFKAQLDEVCQRWWRKIQASGQATSPGLTYANRERESL